MLGVCCWSSGTMPINSFASIRSWHRLLGRRGKSLAKLAVTLGCIAVILWFVDWRVSLDLLGRTAPAFVAMIALLAALGIALSEWKWQRLLVAASVQEPYPALLQIYWIGAFVSTFLPSVLPGDAVRIVIARRFGPLAAIAGSIVVERITGLAVLLLLAAGAVMLRSDLLVHDHGGGATLVAAGGLLIALLLFAGLAARLSSAWQPGGTVWRQRLRAGLLRFGTSLAELARQPGALLIAGGLSVAFYGVLTLSHYTAFQAVGLTVSLSDLAAVAPLVILVATLPVAPSGLGIGEGAFVLLYAQIGVAPETALAAAVLRRATVTLVALVGGLPWLAPASKGRLSALRADARALKGSAFSADTAVGKDAAGGEERHSQGAMR